MFKETKTKTPKGICSKVGHCSRLCRWSPSHADPIPTLHHPPDPSALLLALQTELKLLIRNGSMPLNPLSTLLLSARYQKMSCTYSGQVTYLTSSTFQEKCPILHCNQSWGRQCSPWPRCPMLRLAPSSGPDFTVMFDFTNTIASRKVGSVLQMAWEKQPLLSAAFVMLNIHPSISPSLPTTAQSSVLWVSGLSISDVGS